MNVKLNPIIDMDIDDMIAIRETKRICKELFETIAATTAITDNAHIVCADNGEVLVTEKELCAMFGILDTIDRIFNEAPSAYDGSGHKELAVKFIG